MSKLSFAQDKANHIAYGAIIASVCSVVFALHIALIAVLVIALAKERYIKVVANKWKDQIDIRAYEALMKYEVEITD